MTAVGGSSCDDSKPDSREHGWQQTKYTKIITMNSKLYVGNMSFNTNEEALRAAFSQFGT